MSGDLKAEIERLTAERDQLRTALTKIDYGAKCDWCADIARGALDALPDPPPAV